MESSLSKNNKKKIDIFEIKENLLMNYSENFPLIKMDCLRKEILFPLPLIKRK